MKIMVNIIELERRLSPESTLNEMREFQDRVVRKTALLHDEKPIYPKESYWKPLPPNIVGVEKEEYLPSGYIKKETVYNPFLMDQSLFDPNILREVAEHEGIHAGTPGKMLLSHLYYDFRDGKIKFGYIEPDSVPKSKYPLGEVIKEGGVKVISEKIGGVEQRSYPISSEMVEEIDKKLTEINKKYSLIQIQKLAGTAEKKLVEENYSKFKSNPSDLKFSEIPNELLEVLYVLNQPGIIGIVQKYAPKTDLPYII